MCDSSIEDLIRKAAMQSNMRHKLGCVIIKGSSILSIGYNEKRPATSLPPRFQRRPDSICAERQALRKIKPKGTARGARLYVGRVNNRGEFLLSKPCSLCYAMASEMGIKKIYYTDGNGNFKEMCRND